MNYPIKILEKELKCLEEYEQTGGWKDVSQLKKELLTAIKKLKNESRII